MTEDTHLPLNLCRLYCFKGPIKWEGVGVGMGAGDGAMASYSEELIFRASVIHGLKTI